ncbi:MAG: RluA family pseudouridine synthase [Lactobacillales bacterium]|nr:RluA family pseudouridine synthase [Lactobacillales bacterium]
MKINFTIESGRDLDEFLRDDLLIPKKIRHFLRMDGGVTVDGDVVTVDFKDEYYPAHSVMASDGEVDVVYEDEHLIVVDKSAGMKTHNNSVDETDTLINYVAGYLESAPYVVHRLDRETSGLVMFAKNPVVLPILTKMLEGKAVSRTYIAKVSRSVKDGVLSSNIGRDRHEANKYVLVARGGKTAVTHVRNIGAGLVECVLETGRTHQIRVHLGCVVGDPLYNPKSKAPRMMLHALQMDFVHPITKEAVHIESGKRF